MLGGADAVNIMSLIQGGYEISRFAFSFEQGIDRKGKATTRVYAGSMNVSLSRLPPQDIIEWGLQSRKYMDGMIVAVDADNIPIYKTIFKNAACVGFEVDYTQKGKTYTTTKLIILAEQLIVEGGVTFTNEWTEQ
jgi:hypothetical protein